MLARASGALTLPENLSDDLSGYLRNPTQFVEHFWPTTGAKFRPFFPMAFPIRLTPVSRTPVRASPPVWAMRLSGPCPEGSLLPHGGTGSRQRRASCLETPCGSQRAPPRSSVRSFREPQPPEPPPVYSQNAVYSTDHPDLGGRLNQSARKEMYKTPWERKGFCHHRPPAE